MSKRQWLSLLGVWVMVFLFLGFPSMWHKIIAILSGLIIVGISYNLAPENKNDTILTNSSFVENKTKNDFVKEIVKEGEEIVNDEIK